MGLESVVNRLKTTATMVAASAAITANSAELNVAPRPFASLSVPAKAVSLDLSGSALEKTPLAKIASLADSSVKVEPNKDPAKTIYVIHELHPYKEMMEPEGYRRTVELQKDIAAIAEILTKELKVKGIYKDGFSTKLLAVVEKHDKFAKSLTDEEKKILAEPEKETEKKLLEKYTNAENDTDRQRSIDLAAYKRYLVATEAEAFIKLKEKNITIFETESAKEIATARSLAQTEETNSPKSLKCREDREDFVIDKIMKSSEKDAVLIMGYFHDFTNQTETYNQAHPDHPIKLVVIDPKGIKEIVDKLLIPK